MSLLSIPNFLEALILKVTEILETKWRDWIGTHNNSFKMRTLKEKTFVLVGTEFEKSKWLAWGKYIFLEQVIKRVKIVTPFTKELRTRDGLILNILFCGHLIIWNSQETHHFPRQIQRQEQRNQEPNKATNKWTKRMLKDKPSEVSYLLMYIIMQMKIVQSECSWKSIRINDRL